MKAPPQPPSYFRIVAEGPTTSSPLERITHSALEAERELHALTRLCGRAARVTVWGKNGRAIGQERLANLARAERPAETNTIHVGEAPPGPPGPEI